MNEDPIGLRGGPNLSVYAANKPSVYSDPLGLDVQVCFYADAAGGFGHVGFGLPGETTTQGYYPTGRNPLDTDGAVWIDQQQQRQCKTVRMNPDQDGCMLRCRLRRATNPGRYKLMTRQCTSFVRDCLNECAGAAGDYNGPRPENFFNALP